MSKYTDKRSKSDVIQLMLNKRRDYLQRTENEYRNKLKEQPKLFLLNEIEQLIKERHND